MPVKPLAPSRWRRVFPGQEAELRQVRYWLGELLPDCPARGDLVTVTIELAANAVRHSASGLGGFFAVELSWLAHPATVRVAVADAGGLHSPQPGAGSGLAALLGTGPLPVIPPGASPATVATLNAAGPARPPALTRSGRVSSARATWPTARSGRARRSRNWPCRTRPGRPSRSTAAGCAWSPRWPPGPG